MKPRPWLLIAGLGLGLVACDGETEAEPAPAATAEPAPATPEASPEPPGPEASPAAEPDGGRGPAPRVMEGGGYRLRLNVGPPRPAAPPAGE